MVLSQNRINRGTPSNHPCYFWIFHYKPSILGYPHLWKRPYNLYICIYIYTHHSWWNFIWIPHVIPIRKHVERRTATWTWLRAASAPSAHTWRLRSRSGQHHGSNMAGKVIQKSGMFQCHRYRRVLYSRIFWFYGFPVASSCTSEYDLSWWVPRHEGRLSFIPTRQSPPQRWHPSCKLGSLVDITLGFALPHFFPSGISQLFQLAARSIG